MLGEAVTPEVAAAWDEVYWLMANALVAIEKRLYETGADHTAGSHRTGLVDLTPVAVPKGTRAYLCGPLPFMRAVRAQLIGKGVAPADIHYEVFGPDLWLAQAG
ncbi:ferredoxin-NADP reductase [Streptomyces sp. V4I8]